MAEPSISLSLSLLQQPNKSTFSALQLWSGRGGRRGRGAPSETSRHAVRHLAGSPGQLTQQTHPLLSSLLIHRGSSPKLRQPPSTPTVVGTCIESGSHLRKSGNRHLPRARRTDGRPGPATGPGSKYGVRRPEQEVSLMRTAFVPHRHPNIIPTNPPAPAADDLAIRKDEAKMPTPDGKRIRHP